MKERNIVGVGTTDSDERTLNQIHDHVVIELIRLITGDIKIHRNHESKHLTTILSNDTGTSITVDCQLIVLRGEKRRLIRVIIKNQVVDEKVEFSYTTFDVSFPNIKSIDIDYMDIDDGFGDIVSNDGVLNEFYRNSLKNGSLEDVINRML